MVRAVVIIGGTVLLAWLAMSLIMALGQNRLVFLPHIPGRELVATPEARGLPYEEVWLETADELRLHAWWLPHDEPRGALLFLHGNAGNISHRLDSLEIFHQLGLSVLILDYRGYGRSEGRPDEAGVYQDAEAALSWLEQAQGLAPEEVILFGRSLGAAVAARTASVHPVRGLILESAFTSAPDLGAELYPFLPVRLLARLELDARAAVRQVEAPTLVVHSRQDDIVPFHHGEALYRAAAQPVGLLELRGDHNTGFLVSREVYVAGLDDFLSQLP